MDINVKRVYEESSSSDGKRVLVDRLWPRGMSKDRAHLDEWMKDVAPSDELRKWFGHDPEKWSEFKRRYRKELDDNVGAVTALKKLASSGRTTLLYGARDTEHNEAVVLKRYLEKH